MRKKKNIFILCMCIFVCAIAGLSYTLTSVLGKYYASRFNKGVAVASNVYFNSDKLVKSTGITDIGDIINDSDSINKINVFTNSGSWASGNLLLNFDIRNFDNSILYNESNLDIGYNIEFVLLDEPLGAQYEIIPPEGDRQLLAEKGSRISMEGTIVGGRLDSKMYGISMTMTSRDDFKAARVLVLAYPVSPGYVYRDKAEPQEYRLLGIFQGHPTDLNITIEEACFKVQKDVGYETACKSKIEDLSGYIYNIKTAGDVVLDDKTAVRQEAVVTWDDRYVTIDKYNDYYNYAIEHDKKAEEEGSPERYLKKEGDKTSMTILVLPYSSIEITYYKTEGFNKEFNAQFAGTQGREWFENLVTARMAE